MRPNQPALKDGPNTASRRRPLKRPQREPTEYPLSTIWRASIGQSYDQGQTAFLLLFSASPLFLQRRLRSGIMGSEARCGRVNMANPINTFE